MVYVSSSESAIDSHLMPAQVPWPLFGMKKDEPASIEALHEPKSRNIIDQPE